MKTANKAQAVKTPVNLVREPLAIDQMLRRNSLGYLESGKSSDISLDDAVGYVVHKLEAGQSAIREIILLCGLVFKTKTAEEAGLFEESLKSRWSGSTLPNLISISKQLGKFEAAGLDLTKVKDLYGVRDCAKLLKSEKHGKAAIAMLNEGKAPRAVQKELNPKSKPPAPSSPAPSSPAPVNIAEEADKLETLILTYADRYSKVAEGEARLKIARHIIAKLNLGGYILMHADAAAAVQTLKANK